MLSPRPVDIGDNEPRERQDERLPEKAKTVPAAWIVGAGTPSGAGNGARTA